LSAHLTKPIIDPLVTFIGKPRFITANKRLQTVYDSFNVPYFDSHRIAIRDGDCAIWPQWKKDHVEFLIVPPETIHDIQVDPDTKEILKYILKERIVHSYKENAYVHSTITIEITPKTVTKTIQSDEPIFSKVVTSKNPFNFIPLVLFTNDKEPFELRGHSELENIEPLLKFYHDMTLDAGKTQQRDGRPKTKVTTASPQTWIDNNFGTGTFERVKAGGATVSMQDRDLFINKIGENVEYIESNKATGDYSKLSEIAFMNLVEGAQTPEIIFGANLGTNLAAAIEQRPIWRQKVTRYQSNYNDSWVDLFKKAFAIQGFATFTNLDREFELEWPDPDFASTKEKADSLNVMANALVKLKEYFVMSDEEIHDTLKHNKLVVVKDDFSKHDSEVTSTVDKTSKRRKKIEPAKENADSSGLNNDPTAVEDEEEPEEDTEVEDGKTNG